MDPVLNQLPQMAKELLHQLETYCGLEFQILYNPDLQGHEPEIFASPGGDAIRLASVGMAHNITKFEGDQLVKIGIEHCMDPLTVEVVAHELLHVKHIVLDRAITRMEYCKQLGLDLANGGMYNVLDYVEHIFVYRGMTAFGLNNPGGAEGLRSLLKSVWYQPAGLPKRIVALMAWLQVRFCFPEVREFAIARLLEVDLLEDARKLEATVRPLLKVDRIPLMSECLKAIGFRPPDVKLGFYQRQGGRWRLGSLSNPGFVGAN
jgi:hypothetical protein